MELVDVVHVASFVTWLHVVARDNIGASTIDYEFEFLAKFDVQRNSVKWT